MAERSKYARDLAYGEPPDWAALYCEHSPQHTDPWSRHAKTVAEVLRDETSLARRALIDAGYEPDHFAGSIEATVRMLWEARRFLEFRDGEWRPRTAPKPGLDGA